MEGWNNVPLGDLCEFRNGLWKGKKPPYINVGVIRNTNFTKAGFLDDRDIAYHDVEEKQFAKRQLQFGDLILEKSGGGPKQPVGRVITFEKTEGLFSFSNFTSVIRVIDTSVLSYKFLHRFLYWQYVSGVTEGMQSHSTGIRNLNFTSYKELSVPLPPLPEQERIVAILDEAFAAIATATANAEKNLANARELFESQLEQAFSGDASSEEWPHAELGDVCGFSGGSQPPKSTFIHEPRSGYVRLLQIRDFTSDKKAVYIPKELAKRNCDTSDIMLARYGASVGQVHRGKAGSYNVALIKTSPDTKQLEKNYFYFYLLSPLFQSALKQVSARSAQAGFSKSDIHDFKIPLPPLPEQERIVAILDEASANSATLTRIGEQKLAHLADLKQSLLHKAFTGELTADSKAADRSLSEANV